MTLSSSACAGRSVSISPDVSYHNRAPAAENGTAFQLNDCVIDVGVDFGDTDSPPAVHLDGCKYLQGQAIAQRSRHAPCALYWVVSKQNDSSGKTTLLF
jgi:hypothetical protein